MNGPTASLPPAPCRQAKRRGFAFSCADLLRCWRRCRAGLAATEFALIAPTLAFSLLATVDLALGMSERMELDHMLRAGAQAAMKDPGTAAVESAMWTAAGASPGAGSNGITLSVTRFCACPDAVATPVSCSTNCTGAKPTYTYYRMAAQTSYAGNVFPTLGFNRALQVQIR